ncbi:MAG TPA: hypothetical protein VFL27_13830 [Candidatus Dormibacteraeota bacterium]|nr:hypothetical protein [Candidatus Dormibacteraeota bacterium]
MTRSFRIAWTHKYLWLIAFLSGEGGGNAGLNYTRPVNRLPDFGAMQQQATTWVIDHVTLIEALALVALVLAVFLFVLAAACEGATIRGSAEHDAERPFGLANAWPMGLHTMWVMVRFRLALFVLNLPLLAAAVAWVVVLLIGLIHQDVGLVLGTLFGGLLLFLVFLVYALYLLFLDRFGSRAVVLEQRKALAAIARAHRLLFKRFGRSLLVLVISLAISLAIAVVAGFLSSILLLPLLIAGYTSSATFWPILAVTAVVLVPAYLVIAAFLGAQNSTYWTLAFRRLDVEYGYTR